MKRFAGHFQASLVASFFSLLLIRDILPLLERQFPLFPNISDILQPMSELPILKFDGISDLFHLTLLILLFHIQNRAILHVHLILYELLGEGLLHQRLLSLQEWNRLLAEVWGCLVQLLDILAEILFSVAFSSIFRIGHLGLHKLLVYRFWPDIWSEIGDVFYHLIEVVDFLWFPVVLCLGQCRLRWSVIYVLEQLSGFHGSFTPWWWLCDPVNSNWMSPEVVELLLLYQPLKSPVLLEPAALGWTQSLQFAFLLYSHWEIDGSFILDFEDIGDVLLHLLWIIATCEVKVAPQFLDIILIVAQILQNTVLLLRVAWWLLGRLLAANGLIGERKVGVQHRLRPHDNALTPWILRRVIIILLHTVPTLAASASLVVHGQIILEFLRSIC